MSIEAGSGLVPSSWSMISGFEVIELRNFSRAWSFVVKFTVATPSTPRRSLVTLSMPVWFASSATYAVMETSSSTEDMRRSTITPPTRKMPMMSSERKIVMIDPNAVEVAGEALQRLL